MKKEKLTSFCIFLYQTNRQKYARAGTQDLRTSRPQNFRTSAPGSKIRTRTRTSGQGLGRELELGRIPGSPGVGSKLGQIWEEY
jgi:hypothetical protein